MSKKKLKVSAIIIAKNEEEKIGDALESVDWADEILVVDTGSTDKTPNIAKKHGAKLVLYPKGTYKDWRNIGIKKSKGEWIFYIDADERCTPLLKKEIQDTISSKTENSAFAIPRKNIILGKEMTHGGWWPDYVKRLFRKSSFDKWIGELHEEPKFDGSLGHLDNPLIHIKHDNLSEMVEKSNKWSEKEAKLFFDSGHPRMSWWRFIRVMLTELWHRMFRLRGFMDGGEGIIYALYQTWYRFLVYAKLWEMQSKEAENVK